MVVSLLVYKSSLRSAGLLKVFNQTRVGAFRPTLVTIEAVLAHIFSGPRRISSIAIRMSTTSTQDNQGVPERACRYHSLGMDYPGYE